MRKAQIAPTSKGAFVTAKPTIYFKFVTQNDTHAVKPNSINKYRNSFFGYYNLDDLKKSEVYVLQVFQGIVMLIDKMI